MTTVRAQVERGSAWGSSGSSSSSPARHQSLELGRNLRQDSVDAHLWLLGVAFLAHGAEELLAVGPVALQAGLAEAVATWGGHGLHKHLQADGAAELILGENPPSWRAKRT